MHRVPGRRHWHLLIRGNDDDVLDRSDRVDSRLLLLPILINQAIMLFTLGRLKSLNPTICSSSIDVSEERLAEIDLQGLAEPHINDTPMYLRYFTVDPRRNAKILHSTNHLRIYNYRLLLKLG